MRLHISNLTINLGLATAVPGELLSAMGSTTAEPANDSVPSPARSATPPAIGERWVGQGGVYAGEARGEGVEPDAEPDGHLVLLDDVPPSDLDWPAAVKWAEGLGNGARLPTRFESALMYANLRDKFDTERWHWTGTQSSEADAWSQTFDNGYQTTDIKSFKARARAVRRFAA